MSEADLKQPVLLPHSPYARELQIFTQPHHNLKALDRAVLRGWKAPIRSMFGSVIALARAEGLRCRALPSA